MKSLTLGAWLSIAYSAVVLHTEASADDSMTTSYDCLVEPYVLTDVGSAAQGVLTHVLVERGDSVVRGQALAQLESRLEQATLLQAEARADMQSEVITREADLALARLDRQRFEDLESEELVPQQQRDEAIARERIAHAALVQALENRKLHQLDFARAQAQLAQRTIRSPIDGVVVRQLLSPGELVYDDPVMTLADLDPLRVEVVLPARLFRSIKAGDPAQVHLELADATAIEAIVDRVDAMLDSRSGTFGVRLLLPNHDLEMAAGQRCEVVFEQSLEPSALAAEPLIEPMGRPVDTPVPVAGSDSVSSGAVRD